MAISTLPFEVLEEIFEKLDSVERTRVRRVCCLWDSIISSKITFKRHLSLKIAPLSPVGSGRYPCARIRTMRPKLKVTLDNLVDPTTRTVTIAGFEVPLHIDDVQDLNADVSQVHMKLFGIQLDVVTLRFLIGRFVLVTLHQCMLVIEQTPVLTLDNVRFSNTDLDGLIGKLSLLCLKEDDPKEVAQSLQDTVKEKEMLLYLYPSTAPVIREMQRGLQQCEEDPILIMSITELPGKLPNKVSSSSALTKRFVLKFLQRMN